MARCEDETKISLHFEPLSRIAAHLRKAKIHYACLVVKWNAIFFEIHFKFLFIVQTICSIILL